MDGSLSPFLVVAGQQGRDGWTTSRFCLSLFLAPSPSPLVSLGKEAMEGPSFIYLPLTLSRSLSLTLALLGQGSDGRALPFFYLQSKGETDVLLGFSVFRV